MYRNMRRILLLLPLLSVGAVALKKIIHRIDEPKTWADAQAYCRQHHIDLVTIRDDAENLEITLSGWIGLNRAVWDQTWKWSSGYETANFQTWHEGEPEEGQNCGYKKEGNIGWHTEYCQGLYPFYCFDEPLIIGTERKTWEEALEHCRHLPVWHHTVYKTHRYDLASPLTPVDNAYAQKMWNNQDGQWKWIGLRYLGDRWTWITGESYDWKNCPVINRCGSLERNSTFHIDKRNCAAKQLFLCSRVPGSV